MKSKFNGTTSRLWNQTIVHFRNNPSTSIITKSDFEGCIDEIIFPSLKKWMLQHLNKRYTLFSRESLFWWSSKWTIIRVSSEWFGSLFSIQIYYKCCNYLLSFFLTFDVECIFPLIVCSLHMSNKDEQFEYRNPQLTSFEWKVLFH